MLDVLAHAEAPLKWEGMSARSIEARLPAAAKAQAGSMPLREAVDDALQQLADMSAVYEEKNERGRLLWCALDPADPL